MSEGEPRVPFDPPPPEDVEPEARPLEVVPAAEKLPEHEGFLQAIEQNPDDDTPKLIYADWLEERGSVLGEFIRVETALKNLPPGDSRRAALAGRSEEIREQIGRVDAVVFLADTELLPKYEVEIPEGATFDDLVHRGHFSEVDQLITQQDLPITERGKFKVSVIDFGTSMTPEQTRQAIGLTRHYRPAQREHLLVLPRAAWREERMYPDIAAVSSSEGDPEDYLNFIPYIREWREERQLGLDIVDDESYMHYRFLVVHE